MSVGRIAAATSVSVVLSSCATVEQSTSSIAFQEAFDGAEYCALEAVQQQSESVCGLACLESMLDYWELDGTQDVLAGANPPEADSGYSLAELKAIAEGRGLTAFSVSFEPDPLPLLHSQLERGRPTLLAIRCPLGRYFGDPIPVIEYLDSTVISASLREDQFTRTAIASTGDRMKDHFVVAFGYDKAAKKILLMDPAYGLVSISEGRLLTFWGDQNYSALVCARTAVVES